MMGAKKRASLSPEVQRSTGFQGGEGMGGEEVEKPPAARPRRGHIVTVKYWKFVDNPSFYTLISAPVVSNFKYLLTPYQM